jgi:hypothetical protein
MQSALQECTVIPLMEPGVNPDGRNLPGLWSNRNHPNDWILVPRDRRS